MALLPPHRQNPIAAAWALLWLSVRRLRSEPLLPLLAVVMVAVSSGILAAAPRVANRAADDEVRAALRNATPLQRNVQLSGIDAIQTTGELADRTSRLLRSMEPPLQEVITRSDWAALSVRFDAALPSAAAYSEKPVKVVLTDRSGLDGQISVVKGVLPGTDSCGCQPDPENPTATPIPVGIAISDATATFLHWDVGDVVRLTVDPGDPMSFQGFGAFPLDATVVGIFHVRQPTAEYWFADTRLANVIETNPDQGGVVISAALLGDGGFADLAQVLPIWTYQLNYTVDGSGLDAGRAAAVGEAARRLATDPALRGFGGGFFGGAITVHTALAQIVDRAEQAFGQTQAVLLIALLGIGAVAATALMLLAVLLVNRRREAAAIIRGRGGSRTELALPQVIEAFSLALVGGGAGWYAAERLIPARESMISAPAALGMVLVGGVATSVAVLAQARRRQQELERGERQVRRLSPRRLVAEGLIVAGAAAGVFLVRQRGFSVGPGGPDPFLALAPGLAALAVGLVVLRFYPLPVALAAAVAARGRGLVTALGLGRAARRPDAASLPILAVLLAAAMASFAGVVTASMAQAQDVASWQQLGADIRVTASQGGSLAGVPLTNLAGAQAVATASQSVSVPFSVLGSGGGSVRMIGVDAAPFESVTAGTPAATRFPAGFAGSTAVGSQDDPIPAVTTFQIPGSRNQFAVGARFVLAFNGTGVNFEVVAVRSDIPGLVTGGGWVVVPSSALVAVFGSRAPPPTMVFVRGPGAATAVANAVHARDPNATVETRADALGRLSKTPLAGAVTDGFGLAAILAAAFAALAVILGLALSGPERARDTARLRTMGLAPRQILGLAAVEQLPPVIVALAAGGAFGIALAWLVLPGVDLSVFTGGTVAVPLIVDPMRTAALLGAVFAVVLVGVLLAAAADRSRQLGRALRVGDE
jgi:putative ABC transport system permease protein